MDRKTFTLAEVATAYLPALKDGRRWLASRLNNGELTGIPCGRRWVMTQSDIDHMCATLRKTRSSAQPEPEPESVQPSAVPSFADSLSPRSRKRLRAVR